MDPIGNEILSERYRVDSLRVRSFHVDAEALGPLRVVPAMKGTCISLTQ